VSREGDVGEAGSRPDRKLASDGWTTGRTESFSDGVFAIAITLPTKLTAQAIRSSDSERAAVVFYGGTLLVISLLISALWRSAAGRRELLKPDVSEREIDALLRASGPNVGLYVSALVLAIVVPQVGAFAYLLIAIVLLLRARGDKETPERERSR
jgi:uncharacterized membrane protein